MRGRPFEKDRIDRIHLRKPIFPFDQAIDGGAGCFRQVKKNDGLFGFAARGTRLAAGWRAASSVIGVVVRALIGADDICLQRSISSCRPRSRGSSPPPNSRDSAGCLNAEAITVPKLPVFAACMHDIERRHFDGAHSFVRTGKRSEALKPVMGPIAVFLYQVVGHFARILLATAQLAISDGEAFWILA